MVNDKVRISLCSNRKLTNQLSGISSYAFEEYRSPKRLTSLTKYSVFFRSIDRHGTEQSDRFSALD